MPIYSMRLLHCLLPQTNIVAKVDSGEALKNSIKTTVIVIDLSLPDIKRDMLLKKINVDTLPSLIETLNHRLNIVNDSIKEQIKKYEG